MAWKRNAWSESISEKGAKCAPVRPARINARVGGLLAGMLVVCGVAVAWFLLMPSNAPVQPDKVPKAPPRQKQNQRTAISYKAVTTNRTEVISKAKNTAQEKPEYVKKPGQLQLPNGKLLTFPVPKEGETRKVYAYGHLYECDHEGNFRDVSERRLFKTAFEGNFLALAAQNKPFIPAFLTGLDESEVRKMLEKPYEPIGDETEDEKAKLKAYDQMRNAALEYMAQGGSFDEFVETFASFAKKERETRATCLREVMTLYKQGKVAEAKEMLQASDILTDRKGFKQIRIPPHVQAAFDKLP